MYTRTTLDVCTVSLALSLAVALAPGAAQAVPASWITNGSGNYSNLSNWDVPFVPCNTGGTTFDVFIPETGDTTSSGTVTTKLADCTVSRLTLGVGARYTLADDGGTYTATTATLGNGAGLSVVNGGNMFIGAIDYSSTGLLLTANLFSSANPGSVLDLSSLQTLNAGFVHTGFGTLVHTVTATDSGVIDLSGLTSVTAPASDEDRLDFTVTGPVASIDLSSLATIGGGGQTMFRVSGGGSQSIPALENVVNGRFLVSEASTLTANGPLWDYASTGLLLTANLFSSANPGSVLDMSSLQTLNAGFVHTGFGTLVHTVTATDSGVIDLSGLTSVTAPASDEDRLDFTVTGPVASIDLSSLATIGGGGQTMFRVSGGGSQSIPALENVVNSRFLVSEASTLTANGPLWDYASTGLLLTANLFSSANPGSVLDMSSLQTLDAGFVHTGFGTLVHTVTATDSGVIDLSGLTSVTAPASDEDRLDFTVTGPVASIDLSSLATIGGGGQTMFRVSGGGSQSIPALENVVNGRFLVSEASTLTANGPLWDYASTGLLLTANLFSSANPGSVLDLSSLQTLNAGFVHTGFGTLVHTVTATDSGVIDLSGLTSVTAPASGEDRLDFVVTDAELRIGAMENVSGAAGQTRVLLNDPLSLLVAPASFKPDADVTIAAVADSTVRIAKDYSFAHSDENLIDLESAVVHFNGSVAMPQFVEAGGFDIGTLVPAGPNFGFGQMVVGTGAQATTVNLRDAVDNGNGHVLCGPGEEALYLLGLPTDPSDPGKIVNGLRILGGSTLVLNGIPLYTLQDGALVDVRTWFGPGQNVLAYALNDSNGFIALGSSPDTDADADGVLDVNDNCVTVANADQRDTNVDGYGNICDPDLDNNGVVQAADLAIFKPLFFTGDPDADFDGNGVVQAADLAIMKRMFFGPPGPSCVAP